MKKKRTVQPLPRYVRRKEAKRAPWAYYFDLPPWARKAGDCPVKNEALGTNYHQAVHRAETLLLPAFDAWLSGGECDQVQVGTLDWLFNEYRNDRPTRSSAPNTSVITNGALRWSGSMC